MLKFGDLIKDAEYYNFDNTDTEPEISVIMPVYCHNGKLLRRSIESVLRQTFKNFELIIVDDGSRDGSFNTVLEYAQKDARVRIIRHKLNCGLPAIRVNEGILAARGKYISYQFDDDEYLPDCLEILHTEITSHDEPCLVYGKTVIRLEDRVVYIGAPYNYALLNNENQIANNSVMHHKCIMELSGMYDPHIILRRFCDYDLWLRMGRHVPFYFVDEEVTNVYAGQKGSLGADVAISNFPLLRRYLETYRDNRLIPEKINDYDVVSLTLTRAFNQGDIDTLNRIEIIPFLSRTTYYLDETEKNIFNITRNKKRNLLVTKTAYSTSVDVVLKNHLVRCDHLPYTYTFCKGGLLSTVYDYVYDMAVFYRSCEQADYNFLKHCKAKEIPTVYLSDDNMLEFYKTDPKTFAYIAPGTPAYETTCKIISESDSTISYSRAITKSCSQYTDRIMECSTNIPAKYLSVRNLRSYSDRKIRFGVFSGNVRREIFSKIWDGIVKFAEEYKDKIEIEFWGIDPSEFEPLPCFVKHVGFSHSYDLYLKRLSESYFDFQICPLENVNETDKSKSPIKYLEGAITGAVGIFSNRLPYYKLDNTCCLRAENTPEAWYNILCKAINMSEEERYQIYLNSIADLQRNYTTEANSISFLTALDAAVLHGKLNKRKIAFVPHESLLGGATLHIFRHLRLMKSLCFDVVLCLPEQCRQPDLPEYAEKYGINVEYIPCRRVTSPVDRTEEDYKNAEKIVEWAKENNIGLFHSVTFNTSVALAAQMMGIPHVATLHQYYASDKPFNKDEVNIQAIHSSSNRYALEWNKVLGVPAYRMVCPVSDEFFNYYNKNKTFNVQRTEKSERVDIILSGTLQPRKNQLGGIKAALILLKRGYDVHVSLIGYDNLVQDYATECRDEIEKSKYADHFEIVGFTNEPEVYYNQNSQILLCAAYDESMPQTILQAMAAGVFVVSTNCGGVSEIIKNNYNGFIADGNEPEDMADAIERLLKLDAQERSDVLENAHDTLYAIGREEFVRSELVNIYNMAFENLSSASIVRETIKNETAPASVVPAENITQKTIPADAVTISSPRYKNALNYDEGFAIVNGGRNLVGHDRFYTITMRTGTLEAVLLRFGTESQSCTGKLKLTFIMEKTGVIIDCVEIDAQKINYVTDYRINITPICGKSGDRIIMKASYETFNKNEYLCIYEKKRSLRLIDRLKYKLNFKSSYRIAGYGIFR